MKAIVALLAVCVAAPAALAGAAPGPARLGGFTTWATSGSRVAFVATSAGGRRGHLWVQGFGAARPTLLRSRPPIGEEEIDELAPGPNGTWGALERTVGNSESYYSVDVVSSRGGGAQVATAGTNAAAGTIPHLVGDGSFLGYLFVDPAGRVQLFRIRGAHARRVANLAGVASPQEVSVAGGKLALREADGTVAVFSLSGRRLATIPAHAASVALTATRVVVRTRTRRLVVYGLRGGLVHDWPLAARSWTAGLASDGRYAVYLGANKAVHAVRLANGRDRVVSHAGTSWFYSGVSLQAPGATVPLTTRRGADFLVTFRFLPGAVLRAALG